MDTTVELGSTIAPLGGVESDNEFTNPQPSATSPAKSPPKSPSKSHQSSEDSEEEVFVTKKERLEIPSSVYISDDEVDEDFFSAERGIYSMSGLPQTKSNRRSLATTENSGNAAQGEGGEVAYDDIHKALSLPTHEHFKLVEATHAPGVDEVFDDETLERFASPEPDMHTVDVPRLGGEVEIPLRPDPDMLGRINFDKEESEEESIYSSESSKNELESEVKTEPHKNDIRKSDIKKIAARNSMLVVSLQRDPDDINPLDRDRDLETGPVTLLDKFEDRFLDFGDWLADYYETIGGSIYSMAGITEQKNDVWKRWVGVAVICVGIFVLLMLMVAVMLSAV